MMNIEFGTLTPHHKKFPFKLCDIQDDPAVDYVCPAWEITHHIKANTVDWCYSRHFFEHLTFTQGVRTLKAWYRVLKPGGKCEMLLPNMTYFIDLWLSKENDQFMKAGIWGWQRGELDDTWDIHKSGYDEGSITELLNEHGFVDIENIQPEDSTNLHLKCYKPI
jgi:predicted SAM-dependent methyltransferase